MRNTLEKKIFENQQLNLENNRLRERLSNLELGDKNYTNSIMNEHEIKDKEQIIYKLE
jgi:regulator of replication initiation timing